VNLQIQTLAHDREILVMRSALCRLRLRRATHDLRESLHWKRAAVAVATAPAMHRIFLGLAVSLIGLSRFSRALMLAGRVVLVAKLARVVIDYARERKGTVLYRTDPPRICP